MFPDKLSDVEWTNADEAEACLGLVAYALRR